MTGVSIGVAMATYNGEMYLRPQLDSILDQQRKPDRVEIVDDGSTDGTLSILEDYAGRHPGVIRVTRNRQNRGATYTFARAMAQCGTRYIALADQDDEWLPEKLAVLSAAAAEHPDAGMWFHDLTIINPAGEIRAESFWAVAPATETLPVTGAAARARIASYSNPVPGCTMFIDTGLLSAILPIPNAAVGHDWWISAVCFFLGSPCAVAQPLGRYRLHPHQVAGIGTRLERRPDEKLRLPVHRRLLREIGRLWDRRRTLKAHEQRRRLEQREKINALQTLLDRVLADGAAPERTAEYHRLRGKIAARSEAQP